MQQTFDSEHWVDENGNPAGGCSTGTGFTISWQHGPLGRGADRKKANGAFVAGIIAAAIDRLEFYQNTEFACAENAEAKNYLESALESLNRRTADREARKVEGTHAL